MANLLPPEVKKEIRKEYVQRVFATGLGLSAIVLCIGLVLLSTTYMLLSSKKQTLDDLYPVTEETETKEDVSAVIDRSKGMIDLLKKDTFARNIPYGVFAELFDLKTEAITFTRLSFSAQTKKVDVNGRAATRDDLKTFIQNIDDGDFFLPLERYPYADLSERKDIDFSLSITVADQYAL